MDQYSLLNVCLTCFKTNHFSLQYLQENICVCLAFIKLCSYLCTQSCQNISKFCAAEQELKIIIEKDKDTYIHNHAHMRQKIHRFYQHIYAKLGLDVSSSSDAQQSLMSKILKMARYFQPLYALVWNRSYGILTLQCQKV